jgi:hypothetical protein
MFFHFQSLPHKIAEISIGYWTSSSLSGRLRRNVELNQTVEKLWKHAVENKTKESYDVSYTHFERFMLLNNVHGLSLCKIVRSSVILLLPLFHITSETPRQRWGCFSACGGSWRNLSICKRDNESAKLFLTLGTCFAENVKLYLHAHQGNCLREHIIARRFTRVEWNIQITKIIYQKFWKSI